MPAKSTDNSSFSLEEWNRSSLKERYEKPAKKIVYVKTPAIKSMDRLWDIIRYTLLVLLALIGIYTLISDRSRMLLYETMLEALHQIGM